VKKASPTATLKDVPEKMLHKYIAIALGLEEFDEEVFAEDVEKVVVKGSR